MEKNRTSRQSGTGQQRSNAARPRTTASTRSASAGSAPRRTSNTYMPKGDKSSFASRLNSMRLTYIRRVPLFYRRVIACAVPALVLAIVVIVIVANTSRRNADTVANNPNAPYYVANQTVAPASTEAALVLSAGEDSEGGESDVYNIVWGAESATDATPEPTVEPTTEPVAAASNWQSGQYAPEPEGPGYLPVFKKADRTDKVIAITVDDCYQTQNLKEIVETAEAVGGKLTIFPIGELLQRESLQEVIRYAHDLGFEIENHTWSHAGLYHNTDTELAQEIFDQDRAVDLILGIDYTTHFLRPRGGDDRNDIRTHAYIAQLGYYGIAHWSVVGTGSSLQSIKESLAPGQVYLFHCIDSDCSNLKQFIPYAVSEGYQLLTMNELFGYEKNAEAPLTDDPMTRTIVQLEPYERDYKTVRNPTYSYMAYEVQAKLKELGFMEDAPDGIYGKGTAAAASKWQESKGFTGDGILTSDQLHLLLDT